MLLEISHHQDLSFVAYCKRLKSNLSIESADDMATTEKLDVIETLLEQVPDFAAQLELHRERPAEQRTYEQLLDRLRQQIDRDEAKQQRAQQEDAFKKQLGNTSTTRGLAGQQDKDAPRQPKVKASPDSKASEQMKQKDRQLTALLVKSRMAPKCTVTLCGLEMYT